MTLEQLESIGRTVLLPELTATLPDQSSVKRGILNRLEYQGYLRRDPAKPRAIEVRYDPTSGAIAERRPTP